MLVVGGGGGANARSEMSLIDDGRLGYPEAVVFVGVGFGCAADVKRSADQYHGKPFIDAELICGRYGLDMWRFGARLS